LFVNADPRLDALAADPCMADLLCRIGLDPHRGTQPIG